MRRISLENADDLSTCVISWGSGNVPMNFVTGVVPGKTTKTFAQQRVCAISHCCFSIICYERTLDLEAKDTEERDLWVKNLLALQKSLKEKATGLSSLQPAEREKLKHFLATSHQGVVMRKHGASGDPHDRPISVEGYTNLATAVVSWGTGTIKLADVTHVFKGKTTDKFKRDVAAASDPECCFSLVTPDRSLDLETKTKEERDAWAGNLQALLATFH